LFTTLFPSNSGPSLHLTVLEFCFNTIISWSTFSSSSSKKLPSFSAPMLVYSLSSDRVVGTDCWALTSSRKRARWRAGASRGGSEV
jgi:hypothetical protein